MNDKVICHRLLNDPSVIVAKVPNKLIMIAMSISLEIYAMLNCRGLSSLVLLNIPH